MNFSINIHVRLCIHYYIFVYTYKPFRSFCIILFIRITKTFYNCLHLVHECFNGRVRVVPVVIVCVRRTFSHHLKQFINLKLFYILQTISVKMY